MTGNVVRINLEAKDNASSVFNNMTKNIRDGTLQANLMGAALNVAANTIGNVLGTIGSKFQEAASLETGMISTTGTIMKLMGSTYAEAGGFIDAFNTKMASVAAALPGDTADYVKLGNGIMDNLIPAFKDLNGVLDQAAYNKTLESITKNAGFLAITSETDIRLATQGLSKLLAGASFDSLKNLKFFEANPAMLGFIEAEAQKLGKDFQDLSARQRAEVIDRALRIPDEVIKASTQSIQGLTASFQSAVFSPEGIFGLMRDIDKEVEGKQTAYQEIGNTFKILFGETGILSNLGAIFSDLTGINADSPMIGLRNGFIWLNTKLTDINNILGALKFGLDPAIALKRFGDMFGRIFRGLNGARLGEELAIAVNGAIPYIAAMAPYIINGIGKGVLFVMNFLGEFIGSLDYGKIFMGLGYILTQINWGTVGSIVLNIVAFGIVKGLAAIGLSALIAGAGTVIASSVLGSSILTGLFMVGSAILAAVTAPIGLIVGGIVLLGFLVYKNIDLIESTLTDIFTAAGDILNSFMVTITDGFNQITAIGGQLIVNFENALTQMLQIPASLISGVTNFLTSGSVDVPISWNGTTVPNSAGGNMPEGMLKAAIIERSAMPSGSSLTVANTSEAILNRPQQQNLAQAIRGGSGSSLVIQGDINIIDNSGSVSQVADQVMQEIVVRWQAAQQNFNYPSYS